MMMMVFRSVVRCLVSSALPCLRLVMCASYYFTNKTMSADDDRVLMTVLRPIPSSRCCGPVEEVVNDDQRQAGNTLMMMMRKKMKW